MYKRQLQDCTFSGYDNKISMNLAECQTIPYVMECIELLFAAYFSRISNWDSARGAAEVFRFIPVSYTHLKSLPGALASLGHLLQAFPFLGGGKSFWESASPGRCV